MSKTPRQRAEACFAVARSTTHDGERDAAISRGKFICDRHSLDLDDFDISGRVRKVPVGGMRGGSFDVDLDLNGAGFARRESAYSSTQEDLFAAYEIFRRHMNSRRRENLFRATQEAAARAAQATREFREASERATPETRQCPACGHYKRESWFGAPCYECVPLAS